MEARSRIASLWTMPPSPLGSPGFTLPDIADFEWHPLGDKGADNWTVVAQGSDWRNGREITVSGTA